MFCCFALSTFERQDAVVVLQQHDGLPRRQPEVRLLVLARIEQPKFQLGLGQACEGQVNLVLLQVASRDRFLTN